MTTTTNTTKKYELTILMDEVVTDKDIEAMTELMKKYGTVVKLEDEEVKRLAYPIRDHEKARYLFYILELENDVPAKLSRNLDIEDNVIRYLLVRA